MDARRCGRVRGAKLQAQAAAGMFGNYGLLLFQARALELAEQNEEALRLYTSMNHRAGMRTLEKRLARAVGSPLQLTSRERQVALLIQQELTNRQIATDLRIGEHTVEGHLRSIFNKLGLRSRWQLQEMELPEQLH